MTKCVLKKDIDDNYSWITQLLRKVAMVEQVSVEDLALDFTVPGYDMELRVCYSSPDLDLCSPQSQAWWPRHSSNFG